MFDAVRQKVQRAISKLGAKSRTFRILFNALSFRPTFMGNEYRDFAEEGYMENPYVYAAITQAANSCAGIPPVLYRVKGGERVERAMQGYSRKGHAPRLERMKKRRAARAIIHRQALDLKRQLRLPYGLCRSLATKALVEQGELEEVPAHEALDLLYEPNQYFQQSYQALIQAIVSYLELGGKTFIEPIVGGSGMPRELYALSPNNVEILEGDSTNPIRGFRFERSGGEVDYMYSPDPTETEIYYMKYFHPLKPLDGLSPLEAAARSTDVNNAARTWNLSSLQNGAMMSGFLLSNGVMTTEQRQNAQDQFRRQHAGPKNAGGVFLIEGSPDGISFQDASMTARDMQWGDLTRVSALEVAIVYNTPPEILGDSRTKTYSNYQEARRAYYLEKIIPLMDFVFGEFNSGIMTRFDDALLLDYDLERVDALQEDMNKLYERVVAATKGSVLQINEAREILHLDPIDGGDVILVPATSIPLEASVGMDEDEQDEVAARALEIEAKRGGDGHLSNIPELFPVMSE